MNQPNQTELSRPQIHLSRLVAGYGDVQILNGIDLDIEEGGVTALIGSNGAGKTTAMMTIAGLLPIWDGDIRLNERSMAGYSSDLRVIEGIVLVPEGRKIFPAMTVEENLRVGAYNLRARGDLLATLSDVFALFPRLRERRHQAGGTLSGGEQQMLAIGRGLMAKPRILLLDEPTLGLAPIMAEQVFQTIDVLASRGVTIFLAEQNVHRTLKLAKRAYVMENGRIVLSGTGAELLEHRQIAQAYLGI